MASDGETAAMERVEWGHVKTKKTLLPVKWTDAVIEDVPVISANALEILAIKRLVRFVRRSQNRATRSAANGSRPTVQVYAQIS